MSAIERRDAIRKKLFLPVVLTKVEDLLGRPKVHKGYFNAKNISATGINIETAFELELGDRLKLEFSLPGERRRLKLEAVVKRSVAIKEPQTRTRKFRSGCKFVKVSAADQIYLNSMITGGFVLV
ncbi:MAG: PilZ domain-containing protein [Bdellovibrionota bacterium]